MHPARNARIRQLLDGDSLYLSDGGLETTLVFHHGLDLPGFASYPLVASTEGRRMLTAYHEDYLELAKSGGFGAVLETATWRAGLDWGSVIGTPVDELRSINRRAVELQLKLRRRFETDQFPILVSGAVGPRGDGYVAGEAHSIQDNERHHRFQMEALVEAGVDLVTSFTLTMVDEAIGFTQAARALEVDSVVGFTVETDGRLPDGTPLGEAIQRTDDATDGEPIFFMVNCAHPDHFSRVLQGEWCRRIGAVRANASRCSHAELDEAETLDAGDPIEFGALSAALRASLPNLRVLGGCCGTDARHVEAIARSLRATAAA